MKSYRCLSLILTFLVCLLAFTPAATAQDAVRLAVSAAAQGGAPVTNLTKADFAVKDSGKPRNLTDFTAPKTNPPAPQKLQPNEFSNYPDLREASGAIFVVLDTIHTRYVDERDARIQILKLLSTAAQAKHAITLAILSQKGLHVYHDYRSGSDVLLAALAKTGLGGMKGVTPPAGVSEADVNAEAARLTAFSKGEESNPKTQEQMTYFVDLPMLMFQEVAMAADGLPGRKMLVWVTNDVPFDIDPKTKQFKSPVESSHGAAVNGAAVGGTKESLSGAEVKKMTPLWRRSVRALFDDGVAVYPVEVRGSSSAGVGSFTIDTMKILAQLTGGKAFYGSNDPFPEILTASAAFAGGYNLAYVGDAAIGTDFHPVEVTVNRADVQVGQSQGYFPYEGTTKSRAGEELGMAMRSQLQFTGILFKVQVAGTEDGAAGKKKVNLVISLPGDAGLVNESTGVVDVGFVAEATNATGQKVGTMNEGAGGKFPPEAVAQIKEMGFQLKRSFEVSPGECTVRFLVRDNQSGKTGDVIFPLTVK